MGKLPMMKKFKINTKTKQTKFPLGIGVDYILRNPDGTLIRFVPQEIQDGVGDFSDTILVKSVIGEKGSPSEGYEVSLQKRLNGKGYLGIKAGVYSPGFYIPIKLIEQGKLYRINTN